MSTISVLIGQCGNQVGTDFLRSVATSLDLSSTITQQQQQRELSPPTLMPWDDAASLFRMPSSASQQQKQKKQQQQLPSSSSSSSSNVLLPRARAVCIDMEPKVMRECDVTAQQTCGFSLPPEGSRGRVTRSSGSGNNWACGYCVHGRSTSEDIAEALRFEAEQTDVLAGFHLVHSIAGGTGSGIGSLASDLVREQFGTQRSGIASLAHTVVWPFEHGELCPQWLNCALSLSVLDETADAVHVISNDVATANLRASPMFVNRGLTKNVSIPWSCVNSWIAREMAALWAPSRRVPIDYLMLMQQQQQQQTSSTASVSYLPSMTFADRLGALCPSKSRVFFESTGTVSVVDQYHHQTSSSTSPSSSSAPVVVVGGGSPGGGSGGGGSISDLTPDSLVTMLNGASASSYVEALSRSYRSHQQQQQGGQQCHNSLIVSHGVGAPRAWLVSSAADKGKKLVDVVDEYRRVDDDDDDQEHGADDDAEHHRHPRRRATTTVATSELPIAFPPSFSSAAASSSAPLFEEQEDDDYDDQQQASSSSLHSRRKNGSLLVHRSNSLSLFSNSDSFGARVERAMTSAETLMSTKAYLHHFTRLGLEEDDLKEAIFASYDIACRYGMEL